MRTRDLLRASATVIAAASRRQAVPGLALVVLWFVVAMAGVQVSGTPPLADRHDDSPLASDRQSRRTPVVDVFERSRDAVVNISATEIIEARGPAGLDRLFQEFFDFPTRPEARQYRRQSVGSGFVIHPQGYIVTNAHVVIRSMERKVVFADGSEYDARIIASDEERDLAILKIDANRDLPSLPFGRSDDLMVGETVIAIGNSLGYAHTVTAGVVSAVNRDLSFTPEVSLRRLIQTDASINPGNSGGPLLNVLGELIGVNTAIRGDAENIGFAIPVDQLREVLPAMLDVNRRYGIETGLTVNGFERPTVATIAPGSPAATAGFQAGDLLAEVDGRPIRQSVDYYIALIGRRPGEDVALRVVRNGAILDRTIRLVSRPAPDGLALAREKLGIVVDELPEQIARELGLRGEVGLLVTEVEPGGPADRAGILRRDILISLGRRYMSSAQDLGQILEAADHGDQVPVAVLRVDRWGKARLSGPIRIR